MLKLRLMVRQSKALIEVLNAGLLLVIEYLYSVALVVLL